MEERIKRAGVPESFAITPRWPECSRRGILAFFCSALVRRAKAQERAPTAAALSIIDFHHHFYAAGPMKPFMSNVPTPGPVLSYTPERSLAEMDSAGVKTAMLSCPVKFGDDPATHGQEAVTSSRQLNEYGARLVSDHKGRFGLLAVLPLPNTDASLREIEYAFDTLKADGVGLMTSYGNHWLGDKAFQPVFDELNRRAAVVYSHPLDGPCCHNLLPDTEPQTIEWNTDTSRAIWSLINDRGPEGTVSMATRYDKIRFLWSHAGGTLLGLLGRFLGPAATTATLQRQPTVNSRLHHLRRFYYDTAGSANPIQMRALKDFVGRDHILFGSDFPFVGITSVARSLQTCGFNQEELHAIQSENAARLIRSGK